MIKELNLFDSISLYGSSTVSIDEVNVLTLLYAPLIKADAYKMYMSFVSLLNRSNLSACNLLHKELLDLLGFDAKQFYRARVRLEAINLLATYQNGNEYIFLIKAPLSAKAFISDGVLGMYLYSELGDNEFRKIQKLFQLPKIDKSNYQEITASFDDVFESVDNIKLTKDEYLLDHKINHSVKIKNYDFDFELFKSGIVESFLDGKRVTKRFETFITNIAYAYMFNEAQMQEIYKKSINSSGYFDYTLCTKKAREKYQTLYNAQLPSLAVKEEINKSREEEAFTEISAKTLLESFGNGTIATLADISKIEDLYHEYSQLSRAIINVCVAYCIKKCDGEIPAYNYFTTVLNDWIVKGINSFEMAKDFICPEESKKGRRNVKKNDAPNWLKEYVEKFDEEVEDL